MLLLYRLKQLKASCMKNATMIVRYYRVDRRDIAAIQFIIEGYEGMAVVTTIDPKPARLQISIIADQQEDFDFLLRDLQSTFPIEEVPCT
ncbi:MAG: DUF4911 domain-containing protein [Syntrophales bacterium]|nr:DUF4911 domain-containing protein [Syntrophales bacterium]